MSQKFAVCVETNHGNAYLEAHGRMEWSKRIAQKHAQEFTAMHGRKAWIEES